MRTRTHIACYVAVGLLCSGGTALAAAAPDPVVDGTVSRQLRALADQVDAHNKVQHPGTPTTRPTQSPTPTPTDVPSRASVGSVSGFSPGGDFVGLRATDQARELDGMRASGATWVRIDFSWASIESTKGVYNWASLDQAVNAADARGLKVLALTAYTPAWARPAGTTSKHAPTNPVDFAEFVAAAGSRYGPDRVQAWEIWNEPNIDNFWKPAPNVASYTRLLLQASAKLRVARPGAYILAGAMSPATDNGTDIAPETFLRGIYANGGKGAFDAVSVHPYSFPALPMDASTGSWNTFYRMSAYRDIMVQAGDSSKPIWGTEWGAPSGTGSGAVSQQRQAEILVQGYEQLRSRRWPWLGPLFVYQLRDLGTDSGDREQNFGLLRRDWSPKPSYSAFAAKMGEKIASGEVPDGPHAP